MDWGCLLWASSSAAMSPLMCLIIGQVGRKGRKEMRLLTGYLERFKEVRGEIGWMDG